MKIRILIERKTNDDTVVVEPLWDRFKKGAGKLYHKATKFVVDHKDEAITAAAATATLVTSVGAAASRIRNSRCRAQEDRFRRDHYYDRSVGAWIETKHQLNSNELRQVRQLQSQGMRLWEAMDYLNLLRK